MLLFCVFQEAREGPVCFCEMRDGCNRCCVVFIGKLVGRGGCPFEEKLRARTAPLFSDVYFYSLDVERWLPLRGKAQAGLHLSFSDVCFFSSVEERWLSG